MTEVKKSVPEKSVDALHIYKVDAKKDKNAKSEDCCPCTKPKNLPDDEDDAQFQIKFEDYLQNNVFYKKYVYGIYTFIFKLDDMKIKTFY